MSYEYGLVGITNASDAKVTNTLLNNFISFYDWGFLEKGGYYNMISPASGIYGVNRSALKVASDPKYPANTVWQSSRENWVWESGINRTTPPVQISGIYKNNQFLPYSYNPTSGYYVGSGYRIDHKNGRVIFNSAIPATSVVTLNYSYKWVSVESSEGLPFIRHIQTRSFRPDEGYFTSSGNWVQLGQTRVQLPAIFIEVPKTRSYKPFQLGGGQYAETDVVFYILTENYATCNDIQDTISYQNDRIIQLYNLNTASKSGDLSFNYRGDLISKTYNYPYLIDNHRFSWCRIYNTTISDSTELSPNFYMGTVRCSTEIELTNLT